MAPRMRILIKISFQSLAKIFVGDVMNGKEISQAKNTKAHLLVNRRRKVFASIAHASGRMKLAQLLHSILESLLYIIDATSTEIDML